MSKVRIYDLAKELKLESKKILEDARSMGVDVSVPSNTLEDNIAAKIREMYYPKKEQAPAIHKARLIKHQTAPGAPAEQPAAAAAVIEKAQQAPKPVEAEPPARPPPQTPRPAHDTTAARPAEARPRAAGGQTVPARAATPTTGRDARRRAKVQGHQTAPAAGCGACAGAQGRGRTGRAARVSRAGSG